MPSLSEVPERGRILQWVGLVLLGVTCFWPTFHFTAHPLGTIRVEDPPAEPIEARFPVAGGRDVPAAALAAATSAATVATPWWEPFWAIRRWYPWFLWPLWALALLATASSPAGSRRRRVVGTILWVWTLGLLGFEAAYLRAEYVAFLPGWLGRVEVVGAWIFVACLLLWRRPPDRSLGAVEASIAAQALLGVAHAVTLPSTMARQWWGNYGLDLVAQAVWTNFPAAFWMGLGALLLVAGSVYLRRSPARRPGSPRVDSESKWGSPGGDPEEESSCASPSSRCS